jgi:hypothetical protein
MSTQTEEVFPYSVDELTEKVIVEFPNYTISKAGVVKNIAQDKVMTQHRKKARLKLGPHVKLRKDGRQYTVAIRDLMKATFPNPKNN